MAPGSAVSAATRISWAVRFSLTTRASASSAFSRPRLNSQLLAESLILAAAGGVLGLILAEWGTSLLIAAIPDTLLASAPFLRDAHTNLAVLAFLCVAVIFTGIAFGLAPALQISRGQECEALKEETRASAGGVRTRLRGVLVVAEIAFPLVLLIGSGLMVKSLTALLSRDPGFDTKSLLTFSENLPPTTYPDRKSTRLNSSHHCISY